jgi:hypothetical protein
VRAENEAGSAALCPSVRMLEQWQCSQPPHEDSAAAHLTACRGIIE